MRHLALLLYCLISIAPSLTVAQSREGIGTGRLFNNDLLGDGGDRWRTGSYVFSYLRAPKPYDGTPQGLGEVLEYRFRSEIIAPTRGTRDRPYAGILSMGLHTHGGVLNDRVDVSLGTDVLAIGPQTGMADFQEAYHKTFSLPRPSTRRQLPNQFAVQSAIEADVTHALPYATTMRTFVQAQTGAEDLVRAGADLIIGRLGTDDLMLRDVATGQLYRGTQDDNTGVSFVLGGDVAAVKDSLFLPESKGYVVSETRSRARAGVNWQPTPDLSFFYGATYLSPEFEGQDTGQVVGSLKLNFSF